ncbi:LOW QUALITY PROTEIN: three prime repair exonuclease 4 [Colossoma macropomum]|uniref:LOW QUALITY PROTEIN: three prime repair exonuclease 4 n=1 Tax=Colossoma macropomum TaxID=42526 RepID=UPI001863BA23|nr:LOW QUALITY PROTEIN: three prime repair exonuclease 4 [Colossoma macropomum]
MDSQATDSPRTVFFDLETTGLGPSCDIVQLAAVSGSHTLNLFMVPRCRMEPGASRVTGFRVRRHQLFLHRRPVLTNSLREALVSFITFLRMFGRPLLVGHNIRRFDCLVLARALDEFGLKAAFQTGVVGFLDSLPLARQLLKDSGIQSFKQENLVKTVLGVSYAAHNALADVQALQKLYWALSPTASQIQQHMFSLDSLNTMAVKPARLPAKSDLCEHFQKAVKVTVDSSRDV